MLSLLTITIAFFAAPVEMELLLADFEGPPEPALTGQNLPEGSSVTLSTDQVHSGKRSCKLHYKYPGVQGISYAGIVLQGLVTPLVGEPKSFHLWVCGDGIGQSLRVRLRDATGQTHQYNLGKLDFEGWRQLSCGLATDQGHWGGANDGKLYLPLFFEALLVDSDIEPTESDVYFDDLTYVTVAEPSAALAAEADSGAFGNVIFEQEPWQLRVTLTNRRADAALVAPVVLTATDARGREVATTRADVNIEPGRRTTLTLKAQGDARGLLMVKAFSGDTLLYEGRLAVLPGAHELQPIQNPFFGVCTHFAQGKHTIPETLQLLRRSGVEFLRDELYWSAIEQQAGQFVFPERFDAYMKAAAEAGIQPLIVTTYSNDLYDEGQAPHTDEGRAAYARYVTELIKRYGTICHRWEVWNEPNIGFWRGRKPDPGEYFELLKTTYEAVKKVDPGATVVGVCTAGTDFKFIQGVLERGGGRYMDDLSTHPYRYPRSPEASRFVEELRRTYALMEQHGMGGRKLWLTEIGWPTQQDPRGVDEQTSANYLVRMYVLAHSEPYVAGVAWYDWQDDGPDVKYNEHNFGITKWQTNEAKAGLVAYWVMTRHLSGATLVRQLLPENEEDQRYAFVFGRGDEQTIVAWAAEGEATASWALGCDKVRLEWADAQVEERGLIDGVLSLRLTGTPVFITGRFRRAEAATPLLELEPARRFLAAGERLSILSRIEATGRKAIEGEVRMIPPEGWRVSERGARLSLRVPRDAAPGTYVVRAELRSSEGALLAEAATSVQVVLPFELTWAPEAFEPAGHLKALALIRNLRDVVGGEIAIEAQLASGEQAVETRVPMPRTGEQVSQAFSLRLPGSPGPRDSIPFILRARSGEQEATLKSDCRVWIVHRAARAPVINGDLSDWDDLEAEEVVLQASSGDFVDLVDRGPHDDPVDFSARCQLVFSEEGLHMAVAATDDRHEQGFEPEELWQGDSVQFAVDPGCRAWQAAAHGEALAWYEAGIALGAQGTMSFRWRPDLGPTQGLKAAMVRREDVTVYEVTVPWKEMGLEAAPENWLPIGFSLLINENDGEGREGWLQLFDGIGFSKDPRKFGVLQMGY